MAERLVIGLFQSSGIALDAAHRLVTEGVSSSDIAQRVLKEVGPVPALETDLASMLLDPLLVGNAREIFAGLSNQERVEQHRRKIGLQCRSRADLL